MLTFSSDSFNSNRSTLFSSIAIYRLKEKPTIFLASTFHQTQPVRSKHPQINLPQHLCPVLTVSWMHHHRSSLLSHTAARGDAQGCPACQAHCSENCAPCHAHMWPAVTWGAVSWEGSKQPAAWLCLRGSPAWGAAQFAKIWHVPRSQDWKYIGPLQTKDYYFKQCFLLSYQLRKLY